MPLPCRFRAGRSASPPAKGSGSADPVARKSVRAARRGERGSAASRARVRGWGGGGAGAAAGEAEAGGGGASGAASEPAVSSEPRSPASALGGRNTVWGVGVGVGQWGSGVSICG